MDPTGIPARRTGFVDHDGESLYYELVGDGGLPLILCHGAGGNHAVWFQQVTTFARDRAVVTWDQRGYGRSTDRAGRSGPDAATADLLAICDHLGIARADLAAQSMGGWAAAGAALARPSLARSLVLADTPAGFPSATLADRRAVSTGPVDLSAGEGLGTHPALDRSFSDRHPELAHLYQSLGRMGTADPAVILPRVGTVRHTPDDAARLTMPVLCIVGERDPLVPPAAVHEIASLFPDARVVEIPGSGHSPYFEDPLAWNAAVRRFLDGLDARKPVVDLDHHSVAFAADAAAAVQALRATCPVGWAETYGGFWALTRYEDVSRVLNDAATFSSRHDLEPDSPFLGVTIPPPPMRFIPVEMDPPEFLAYRRLLNPMFAPAAVDRLRPQMNAYADWCIDRVIERGTIDLVYDLASPVPAMVTLELLGLPTDDWPRFATTFHDMAAYPPGTPELLDAFASAAAISEELTRLVADRRARPARARAGGIDALVDADIDGAPVPDDRLVDIIKLILAGGIDTTTGAAAGAFVYLGEHPEQRRRLIDEPHLVEPACEEFVRWVTPTPFVARTATCPVEIGGQRIAEHERVMANLFGANRDPEVFDRPDDVVLDREPNRHASFGFGIHRCVGANLARAELQAMLTAVLSRIPDFVVGDARRYHTAGVQNGYITVPATFTPGVPVQRTTPSS